MPSESFNIVIKAFVKGVSGHRRGISEDDQFHSGTGDGDIHTSQVAEEAYLSLVVGSHQRNQDDIALLSLEAINGIDADETAVGLEELLLFKQPSQILHLSTIWRDDTHVEAFVPRTAP